MVGESGGGRAADTESALVRAAADVLKDRLAGEVPTLALQLGSGLGWLADDVQERTEIPYADLPGWPLPAVEGHAGRIVAGRLAGVPVLALAGRVHLYEGFEPARAVLPVRVLARARVRTLFLTNAAGGIEPHFQPGDFMLIRDHVDLTWAGALRGPPLEGEERWPDLYECWDPELGAEVRSAALEAGIRLREGVYAGVLGPSYETPAEVRMLDRMGAHAVGMSTVPEAIAARASGLRCVGVSCITNRAAGVGPRTGPIGPHTASAEGQRTLSHAEVVAAAAGAAERFRRLLEAAVPRIAAVDAARTSSSAAF